MSLLSGNAADVYVCSGVGTTFTDEATGLVSGTTYQITDTTKRIIDPATAVVVKDGVTTLAESAYQICYPTGKIILAAAPSGSITVSGKYLTASQVAQSHKWNFNTGPNLQDVAVFGSAWEQKAAVMQKGSGSLSRFYSGSAFFFGQLSNRIILNLYENQAVGARYVAMVYLDTDALEVSEGAIIGETVNFTATGVADYAAS